MASVTFTPDGDNYTVKFGHGTNAVASLEAIPEFAKRCQSTRTWWILAYYADHLAADLKARGHTVLGFTSATPGASSQSGNAAHNGYDGGDDWAKVLFARVGPDRADAVFKALTKVLHPDNKATGDTALQRELNAARTATESNR